MTAISEHQQFLDQYQPVHERFVRYCSSHSYGIIETEDLVQEAILASLENYNQLKDKDKLFSYLIGIANNIVRNKKRRLKFKGQLDEQALERLESQAPSPEVALDIHYLLKAMDQLPSKQKEAIILFEVSGFSIKEISEIQESSASATKTRISRGRQKLREMLEEKPARTSLANQFAMMASIIF